ncbi:MAG TPA: hypothetical protein VMR62_25445 [Bryobacteraceae bacterium]|nr:hypothetical protein [Bryobacteraceae bacterium]
MTGISRRAALRWFGAAGAVATAPGSSPAQLPAQLKVGGAEITVSFESDHFDLPQTALLGWVRQAARAVSTYYGKFPVPRARVRIYSGGGHEVSHGVSYGDDGAWTRITVGVHTTAADLDSDWMMTHEMVHYSFPSVSRRHHWIEEGTATYVEPIARVQIGNLTAAQVFSDLLRDMHQGLPEEGDQGLDNTHTWGRTYWGGALYCLLADIGIRKNTANAKGLQDAFRAINGAGGTIETDWPLERALTIGDKATDGKTMTDLYRKMGGQAMMVDLPDLWKQLGVARENGHVVFDDSAPLASARKAIMRGSGSKPET